MNEENENEIKDEMKEYYEQTRTKWQTVKEQLLGEEANYAKLREDLVGYIEKESDLNGWIGKAEDVCEHIKDIEEDGNTEEIFEAFEVGSGLCMHHSSGVRFLQLSDCIFTSVTYEVPILFQIFTS
jgi:hypothetical protein